MMRWLPILVGIIVGIAAAGMAGGLYLGAAWGAVHIGDGERAALMWFAALALVAPLALGFGAYWLTVRVLLLAKAQIHNPETPNNPS